MKPSRHNLTFVLLHVAAFAAIANLFDVSAFAAPRLNEEIVVQMRTDVTVTTDEIRLKDVAKISFRDKRKAEEAGEMILSAFDDKTQPMSITASSVRIRLVLQGWSNQQIRMIGPESTEVTFHDPVTLTDVDVESAALNTMQQVMEVPAEDLQIRLVNSFVEELPTYIRTKSGIRAEVLPPLTEGPGQMSLSVRVWSGDELLLTRVARFDILKRFHVAVARRLLRRGEQIDQDDVQFERRFLATRVDEPNEDEVIGRMPRTDIKAGQIVSISDIGGVVASVKPILVARRSNVRVIAKSGRVQVTLQAAEAMQSGREGDLIQVRNPESKKLIVGRVTANGDVEIVLR
ncbi:MAG: flagellar basal body P-ring formation chaperone FlgA [Planctomyces sp.]|jgi:flagella basal body P-ring formation protein FlgA